MPLNRHGVHFNPRAPRGARRLLCVSVLRRRYISIHVPREGHDKSTPETSPGCFTYFNPRAPRGARLAVMMDEEAAGIFQSTCPARGTTSSAPRGYCGLEFQSTCPARGTTLPRLLHQNLQTISIHVPREGHDNISIGRNVARHLFQSTCPARGTTRSTRSTCSTCTHFNPRAPRGARH